MDIHASYSLFTENPNDSCWLVLWNMFYFANSWECHNPNLTFTPSFFRGVGGSTTNQVIINHHQPYNNH
jgi:hypothetical protein